MVGADVGELRAFASRLSDAAGQLNDIGSKLSAQLHASTWEGSDAEDFTTQWDQNHRRLMVGVAQELQNAATQVRGEADQQEDASAAGGASAGASAGGAAGASGEKPDFGSMSDEEFRDWLRDHVDTDGLEGIDDTEGWKDPFNDEDADLDAAIAHASPSELAMLRDLKAAGLSNAQLAEVLKGGHVWIDDPGLYDRWRDLDGAQRRYVSSHYRGEMTDDQYAVNGGLVGHALFGRVGGGTFIQLERYSEAEMKEHGGTFATYKLTGLNVGPWGGSKFGESHPIEIGHRPPGHQVDDGFQGPGDFFRDHPKADHVKDTVVDGAVDGVIHSVPGLGAAKDVWDASH